MAIQGVNVNGTSYTIDYTALANTPIFGSGLTESNGDVSVNYGNGLTVDDGALKVNYGNGLTVDVDDGSLEVSYGSGLTVNNGGEIIVDDSYISDLIIESGGGGSSISFGSGLMVHGSSGEVEVTVNVGDGLTIDSSGEVSIDVSFINDLIAAYIGGQS